jgi:hypothetical protein
MHKSLLVSVAIVLALVGSFISRPSFARITFNTIDPVAIGAEDGRRLLVTGPIACTAGEKTYLRVTVTQRFTGAVAEGWARFTCQGETDVQQWEVRAVTQGTARFEEGTAWAVGLARTTDHGNATDAHQWLVEMTLVGE